MKKLFKSFFVLAAASLMLFSATSCEEEEPTYGLTSLSLVTLSGQTYAFSIDQTLLVVDNTADPIPIYTQEADLKSCTINFTPTLDAVVSFGGTDLQTTTIEKVDVTAGPLKMKVTFGKWSKEYTINVVIAEVQEDLKKGVRMIADIRQGGVTADLTDYDVMYLNGKFYMNASGYVAADSLGTYRMYSSINGINWTIIESDTTSVGAVGARSVALDGKGYVIGGCRSWGLDVDGNSPETALSWGMLGYTVKHLKVFSSTDFTTVTDHTPNVTYTSDDAVNGPMIARLITVMAPVNFNLVTVHNNKIFWQSGLNVSYGQMQGGQNMILSTSDGITWKEVLPVNNVSQMRKQAAFFSFKGKLFLLGGFSNFISSANVNKTIAYSTDEGVNWTEEAGADSLAIFGAKVVVNKSGTTAYLFGGEYFDAEGNLTANAKVYKSTDGISWTAIEVNENYTGRRSPAVVVDDNNIAWVYGRHITKLGSYGYSTKVDETKQNLMYDVWAFALDE